MNAEERCALVVRERGAGQCECCRSNRATDKSHRVNRSQGGPWTPDNVAAACSPCHGWFHAERDHAHDAGWILKGNPDPGVVPIWLNSLTLDPGWYLLDPDGFATAVLSSLPAPVLPPWVPPLLLPAPRITVEGTHRP